MLIYGYYPPNLNSTNIQNFRYVFSNNVKPEIIHSIGNRDMTQFLHPSYNFKHSYKKYSQKNLNYVVMCTRILIIVCIIGLVYLLIRLYKKR